MSAPGGPPSVCRIRCRPSAGGASLAAERLPHEVWAALSQLRRWAPGARLPAREVFKGLSPRACGLVTRALWVFKATCFRGFLSQVQVLKTGGAWYGVQSVGASGRSSGVEFPPHCGSPGLGCGLGLDWVPPLLGLGCQRVAQAGFRFLFCPPPPPDFRP